MEDTEALKSYFKKLQKAVMYNVDFKFLNFGLIKKNKIDDILCCIIASLPNSYKKIMRTDEAKKLNSIISYNLLFKLIKQRFIFNSDMYLIEPDRAFKVISTILMTIDKDIDYAEKHV